MDRGRLFFSQQAQSPNTNTNGGRAGVRRRVASMRRGLWEAVAEGSSAQSRGRGRRREERVIAVGYIERGRDAGWQGWVQTEQGRTDD